MVGLPRKRVNVRTTAKADTGPQAFTVHLSAVTSISIPVTVDVTAGESPEETIERAIEQTYEQIPGICAHCSGFGSNWSRDVGEGYEVDTVIRDGETVHEAPDRWTRVSP